MLLIFVYAYPNILYTHFLNISKEILKFCIIIDKLFFQRYHFKYEPGNPPLFHQKYARRSPMNYTFSRVAAFCGLRLSYYSTAALLAIAFFSLALTKYRTPTPLYILLTIAVLPSLLEAMFFSNKKEKKEKAVAFPLFCQKYRYNQTKFASMKLAYLLLFVLLAAWHISYASGTDMPLFIRMLPTILAAASLLLRILITLGYRLYFHLFPLKAMH